MLLMSSGVKWRCGVQLQPDAVNRACKLQRLHQPPVSAPVVLHTPCMAHTAAVACMNVGTWMPQAVHLLSRHHVLENKIKFSIHVRELVVAGVYATGVNPVCRQQNVRL